MAHVSIDTIRARIKGEVDGGADEQTPEQSAEESLQPLGGDAGAMSGELAGSDGADAEQTDSTDDAAGSSPDETQAKPKNRANRV